MAAVVRHLSSLGVLPTPLVAAERLASALGLAGPLLVKRDDLTGFAVAGNKARQLQGLLEAAMDSGADVLVTGGSTGSNFVQAAAAAAAWSELGCVVVVAGPEQPCTAHPNLAAAAAWGAQLCWTGDPDRTSIDLMLPVVAAELSAGGRRPFVVPRGGANMAGATGYRFAVDELMAQLDELRPTMVVPTGSGGTLAGLVAGVVALGRPFRVVGASVSRPAGEVAGLVLALAREVADALGEEAAQARDVEVVDARGAGFGVPSAAAHAAALIALRTEGLVLDPVYTAKALAVLPAVVGDGPGLFLHTGGLLDAVAGFMEPSGEGRP